MNKTKTIFCLFLFGLSFLYAKDLSNNDIVDFIVKDNKTIPVIEKNSSLILHNPNTAKIISKINSGTDMIRKDSFQV